MPRLLYIGQAPNPGTGSPVILLRHLQRCTQSGWHVEILPEWGDDTSMCSKNGWHCYALPHREAWWPPLPQRYEPCRQLAVYLWARWLCRHIPKPDAILCYLAWHSDLFCEIAATYGRLAGVPVSCLIHDDATDFEENKPRKALLRKRQVRTLRHNHRNWFVSEAQAAYMCPPKAHQGTLPPIPSGYLGNPPKWKPAFATHAPVYYAGYLWPAQGQLLKHLSRQLGPKSFPLNLIAKESPAIQELVSEAGAHHWPLFPSNLEALRHLQTQAAALIVSYTADTNELLWTRTSMPSKLIEYSFLGLPIILIAPEDTAVMHWARANKIQSAFNPSQGETIKHWLSRLQNAEQWDVLSQEWAHIAHTQWAPETIHKQFESQLLRTTR